MSQSSHKMPPGNFMGSLQLRKILGMAQRALGLKPRLGDGPVT